MDVSLRFRGNKYWFLYSLLTTKGQLIDEDNRLSFFSVKTGGGKDLQRALLNPRNRPAHNARCFSAECQGRPSGSNYSMHFTEPLPQKNVAQDRMRG